MKNKYLLFFFFLICFINNGFPEKKNTPIFNIINSEEDDDCYRIWNFVCKDAIDSVTCNIVYLQQSGAYSTISLIDFDVQEDSTFIFYGGNPLFSTHFCGNRFVKREKISPNSDKYLYAIHHRDSCFTEQPEFLQTFPCSGLVYKGVYKNHKVFWGYAAYNMGTNSLSTTSNVGWILAFTDFDNNLIHARIYDIDSRDEDNYFTRFPIPLTTLFDEHYFAENEHTNMHLLKGSHFYIVGLYPRNLNPPYKYYITVVDFDIEKILSK